MSRTFALPLVLLAGLAFGLPTSVHAAKQKPWTFAIASAADFEAQAAEVRKQMEPEGRFGTISADERTAVEADLDRISSLLGEKGTPARLNDQQQVEMANAQERINAILTGNDGDRLICKFEPRTGKLVWYYQHNRNDQYDLDWVFDRTVGTLDIDGKPRRVVITGGKSGLFDTLDAATGKYLDTYDMGIQDYIDRIDPKTGDKHVRPEKIPGRDKGPVFMCPHGGGGRNWSPTSLNPQSSVFFVNARDVCTDLTPASGVGFLSTGVNAVYAPPPNGDGNYGVLQAIDLENGKLLWEVRRRQTPDMGILTTAGGLLFTGWMDRQFVAYDQKTGKQLWTTGVSGVPNASAITYSIDGKQYVAMVTGAGNPLSSGIPDVIPETQMPPVNSSTIYVFALPRD